MKDKFTKKQKVIMVSVLAIVLVFLIVTLIIVNIKRNQLDDAKDKNDQIEKVIDEKNQNNSNFVLKNIDNYIFF